MENDEINDAIIKDINTIKNVRQIAKSKTKNEIRYLQDLEIYLSKIFCRKYI